MSVTTKEELKEYCLRALGAPVLEINVDDDQLEDRLDEALEYWHQYHPEGIERLYLKHQITQDDITNGWIPTSDLVYGIVKVYTIYGATGQSKSIFDLQYQLRLNDLYDLTSTSVIYYQIAMNHLALLDFVLNGQTLYRFNRLQNKLYLDINWTGANADVTLGQYILIDCYRILDPEEYNRVYNERWLKHYVTALFKKQWAINIKKFQGLQLPGGVTLDGDKLYDEATGEIKELEDELMNQSAPLGFVMG